MQIYIVNYTFIALNLFAIKQISVGDIAWQRSCERPAIKKDNPMLELSFLLCVNTYFDTISVHPIKSAYSCVKMRTVKLVDKLEFAGVIY